ncbi:MAG: DUF1778 domain-containing protein [Rhodanobacteraceae bacterium]|nr:DUF1778 domain-containing protein [Rhodanobacteraceae bacterium]
MDAATDRLDIRLPPNDKRMLARAAQLEGVTLSQFVLAPALERARKVIAEAEQLAVTSNAYQDVLDALADPPQPTAALVLAMRDYEAAGIQWR